MGRVVTTGRPRPARDHQPVQITARAPLLRTDDRLVGGVAAALARYVHVPKVAARITLVVLAFTGFGVAFYLLAWLLIPDAERPSAIATRLAPRDWIDLAAMAAIAAGVTQVFALAGLGLPVRLLVPLVIAAVGLVLVVTVSGGDDAGDGAASVQLPSWVPPGAAAAVDVLGTRRGVLVRAAIGSLLVLGGLAALLGSSGSWRAFRNGIVAVIVIGCGLFLVFGPWLWRLGTELVTERRERIRNEERAEVAAHLHDSVLQTLAMVQRRADEPREVVRLARKQERELRTWLLSGRRVDADATTGSFGAALAALGAELEETHGIPSRWCRCATATSTNDSARSSSRRGKRSRTRSGTPASIASRVYCEVERRRRRPCSSAIGDRASIARRSPPTGAASPNRSRAVWRATAAAPPCVAARARAPRSSS